MLSLRLVIDTNVLVSAALRSKGHQCTEMIVAITRPARLWASELILKECAEMLSRPELAIQKGLRSQLLQLIRNRARVVTPWRRLEIASDPDDNMFIECADRDRADFLVTGKRRHFPAYWKSIQTVTRANLCALSRRIFFAGWPT